MEIVSDETLEEIGKYMTGNREADDFLWTDEEGNSFITYDEIRVVFPNEQSHDPNSAIFLFCYQGQAIARMSCSMDSAPSIGGILGALAIQKGEG